MKFYNAHNLHHMSMNVQKLKYTHVKMQVHVDKVGGWDNIKCVFVYMCAAVKTLATTDIEETLWGTFCSKSEV